MKCTVSDSTFIIFHQKLAFTDVSISNSDSIYLCLKYLDKFGLSYSEMIWVHFGLRTIYFENVGSFVHFM